MRLKGLQVLILCNQIKLWSELLLLKTLFVFRSRACFLQIHFSMTLLPNWHFLRISIIYKDEKMVFGDSILIFWNPWFEILRIKTLKILNPTIVWKMIRIYYTDWMYQIVYFITGTKYSEGNGQGLIFVSKLMHKDGKMNHIQEVKMKRQLCIDFISWFRNWWWVFFLTKRDLVYCITER